MAMSRMTAQVRYVNEPKPGKKMGSLKLSDDTFLSVWPDKLHQFKPGGTYTMDVEEKTTEQGHTFRTVKAILPGGDAPPMSPAAQSYVNKPRGNGGASMARPTDPKDAERMFVCSLLNAGIQAGQVPFSEASIGAAAAALRKVWHDTFGHADMAKAPVYGTNPSRHGSDDMDDEIRF